MANLSSDTNKINFKIEFKPTIEIMIGDSQIGSITFDHLKDMEMFIVNLRKSVETVIRDLTVKTAI